MKGLRGAAVVTGASSGIGTDLARTLGSHGFDLLLVARREEELTRVAHEIEEAGSVRAHVVPCDLSEPEGPAAVAAEVDRLDLPVEFLANNAGFGRYGPYLELDGRVEQDMIRVNMAAVTALTRLLLPDMVERGSGRILNVASTAAFFPGPLMAVYYASKAYVLSYSVALAEELRGTGVSVTCLCPGPTRTEFTEVAEMEASRLFDLSVVMTSRDVARAGVDAALRGKGVHTPGLVNKLQAVAARFFSRTFLARVVRKVMERND